MIIRFIAWQKLRVPVEQLLTSNTNNREPLAYMMLQQTVRAVYLKWRELQPFALFLAPAAVIPRLPELKVYMRSIHFAHMLLIHYQN